MKQDNRGAVRSETHFPASLRTPARDQEVRVTTRDISLSGVFLDAAGAEDLSDIQDGSQASLQIELAPEAGVLVQLEGRVARHQGRGLALQIDSVPLDSFPHLKRLVLLNSQEPDKVLEQLQAKLRR